MIYMNWRVTPFGEEEEENLAKCELLFGWLKGP
jgi:hypothetical protein